MEIRARYVIVGFFVIGLSLALIMAFLWLASRQNDRDSAYYDILFSEDVTGLQIGGVVRYRGVEVGRVDNVRIDPNQIDKVRVTIKIASSTPLYEDSTASLESQGITGIAYILLQGGSADKKLLSTTIITPYPIITAKPGRLQEVLQVINDVSVVVEDFKEISGEFRRFIPQMLTQDNALAVGALVQNLQQVSSDLKGFSHNLMQLSNSQQINQSLQALHNTLLTVEQISNNFNQLLTSVLNPVDAFVPSILRQINGLVGDARDFMASFKRFAEKLERDPSQLILGPR